MSVESRESPRLCWKHRFQSVVRLSLVNEATPWFRRRAMWVQENSLTLAAGQLARSRSGLAREVERRAPAAV